MGQWISEMVEMLMPYGVLGLFVFSFIEASVFPIPPYILFIPMTLAKPTLGLYYALVGTVGSVLGGLFGYLLGYRLGRPFLNRIVKPEILHKIEKYYQKYGDWATALGGITPLPYKIFAISAGVFRNRLATFIPASVIARGIRFFGEAILLMLYGEKVTRYFESFFGTRNLVILILVSLLIIIVWKMGWFPRNLTRLRQRITGWWLAWAARIRPVFFSHRLLKWFCLFGIVLTIVGVYVFLDAVLVSHR